MYALSPISTERLSAFVRNSFSLSPSAREPSEAEISAHRGLMMCDKLSVGNVLVLASYIDETARLRSANCFDEGEPAAGAMAAGLEQLLALANARAVTADELVSLFQLLRALTAANGRCARALWLWRMVRGSDADRRALHACSPAEVWIKREKAPVFRRVA